MSKLPTISGKKAVLIFQKLGYKVVRQAGSHVRMRHCSNNLREPITIPLHNKDLGKGLLRKLLRDVDISAEEFLKLL